MTYRNKVTLGVTAVAMSLAGQAFATNITIYDKQGPNSTSWGTKSGVGVGAEDQETEPGTAAGQIWDLEAFDYLHGQNGSRLNIYSGFNLLRGQNPYGLGDLFIDVDGDVNWAPGTESRINGITTNKKFRYDYVVHFNQRSGTTIGDGSYDIYKVQEVYGVKFDETVFKAGSNPWKMNVERSDKNAYTKVGSGKMEVTTKTDATVSLSDGTLVIGGSRTTPHYIGGIDLGFLTPNELTSKTLFHLTMQCGNDSLVGQIRCVPDAGSTMALMGAAMSGLSFLVRRTRRNS